MALPPPPPGFRPEGSQRPTGMFAAPPKSRQSLPPPPPGFEVDPLESIRASGASITSGYRDPNRNKRVGGVANSDHLRADAMDLTPAKGQSWDDLRSLAEAVAKARGGRVVDESKTKKPHIHLSLPGWGGAPGLPPPPAGFEPVGAAPPKAPRAPAVPTAFGVPSGKAHDGDTFGLTSGRNARLYGVDAFELNQQALSPSGQMIPLGQNAKGSILPFVAPGATFSPTGGNTFGRPVGMLNRDGDAGRSLLRTGNALVAPQFMQGDPRLAEYMEAERLARVNRLGAHGNTYQTPDSFRAGNPDPWEQPKEGAYGEGGRAVFWDEPTPFMGLRPDIEEGYLAIWQDMNSKPEDLLAYAEANGFTLDPSDVRKQYEERAKPDHHPVGEVTYSNPPRPLTDLGDGAVGAALRGIPDTLNNADELGGVFDSLIPGAALDGPRENVWNSERRFGDILWNNIDQNRSILGYDDANHPIARFGGQLAGGIALPLGTGARTAGQLAKWGAVEGGIAGFSAGEGGALERMPSMAGGMALGAAGGAVLGKAIDGGAYLLGKSGLLNRASPEALAAAGRDAAYETAPVVDDALQAAGPTPASRFQPQGGVMGSDSAPRSAAMRMEDGSPELVGMPRERDYINLPPPPPGFTPEAPMLRVEDAARIMDVEQAVKGLNPDDMLPLSQLAPDERAGLGTRAFDKGQSSVYQRGPVDLVGFVRSAGGLRDEGGELRHLGIDNKPRDLDFAQGEGFLGGLVRDDGNRLDDMAERAWEAGYFRERPTTAEFLEALADTHSGSARRWLDDDLGEVAQFEEQQAQRYAMEAAEQDQPDILKVANIRLDKIETPQDIRQAVASIQSAIGDNPSLKRISHTETAEMAEQMGLTPESFLKRRQGQALNHAEAFGLRVLHASALEQTVNLAKKAIGGSDADRAAFLKSATQTAWLQDHVSGAAAEIGRALSQFRAISKATKHSAEAVKAIIDGRGGHDNIDRMAEALIELAQDPADASRFVQKITRPGFRDKFNEYFINGLVSGPKTHAVNIISNLVTAGLQLPEHAGAAVLGAIRRGSTDKVYFSELGPRMMGMLQGARTGLANAKIGLLTGRASDDTHKVESRFQHAISGKPGHVVRTPTRLLTAEDEFFKGMALGSELASQAVRRAKAEGLKGEALTRRIAELNANPTDEMMEQGRDFARYVTFQRRLGDLGTKVSQITNTVPGVKLIAPFIRTPTNLLKYAVERSPASFLLKGWRDDMKAGGARRDLAIVRASSGTALGALAASWAGQGLITGGGPADENERRILMADGWQPYSIKIGDKYYSYARLDPLATTLGMAADFVDKQKQMTPRQAEEQAATLTASIIQNLENKVWLSGMADLGQALDDPERYGGGYVRKTLATIAVPVGASQLAQTLDPTPREAKTVGDAIQARVPGLSDNLRPRLDAWGRPQMKEGGLGPDIVSPFALSTERQEAINQEALRLDLKISEPSRIVAKRRLSDEEFHAYRLKAGEFLTQRFAEIVASPEWQKMTDDEKRKEFERPVTGIKAAARKDAREALGLAVGEDGKEVALPPPPPGFEIAE